MLHFFREKKDVLNGDFIDGFCHGSLFLLSQILGLIFGGGAKVVGVGREKNWKLKGYLCFVVFKDR
ncbi:MAG TPA: hypothetical protein VFE53_04770, partial [Mucilaginibacter sp.]|nr:hypothetical protein [Mucilaginibacter sp.]